MKKIISLFMRNYEGDKLVRNEVVPGAEWVIAGEGIATRKWDGTCCRILGGKLYRRYDAKKGKTPPAGFEPAQDYDPVTGHMPGWILVGYGPEDRWHREALVADTTLPFSISERKEVMDSPDGTYELIGPRINGNPEGWATHTLMPHGLITVGENFPRTYDGIREALGGGLFEGVVWHHPDGRMVKIKTKDFGFKRS